jgi:hypothetical protein
MVYYGVVPSDRYKRIEEISPPNFRLLANGLTKNSAGGSEYWR